METLKDFLRKLRIMETDESFHLLMEEKQPENKPLHSTQAAITNRNEHENENIQTGSTHLSGLRIITPLHCTLYYHKPECNPCTLVQ